MKASETVTKPKCYICGPITGARDGNRALFEDGCKQAKGLGYEPVNPHDNGVPSSATWSAHMRADIKMLCDCEAILMLPGWFSSRGASLEYDLAEALEIDVLYYESGRV